MLVPKSISDKVKLSNGLEIPCLGCGWGHPRATHDETYSSVAAAARMGLRLFDTASFYANERAMGKGLKLSGVNREELLVASKVWNQDQGYDSTLAVVEETLEDFGFDYIDLYMIHWPIAYGHDEDWQELNRETWRAMEKLYREGKIRALGVSNFLEHHLRPLMDFATVPVMFNEIEQSIGYYQSETHEFCRQNNIQTISYTPLGGVIVPIVRPPAAPGERPAGGPPPRQPRIMERRPELESICEKYDKLPSQICLRWLQQIGSVPIPSTYNEAHMKDNIDIFDFELNDEEIALIKTLPDTKGRHQHPDIDRINFDRYIKPKI